MAVCGDGVRGCHGYLQRHEIIWMAHDARIGAEDALTFTPIAKAAAEYLRVAVGHRIESAPFQVYEEQEG